MIKRRYRYQLFIDGLPNATLEKNGQGVLEPNFKEGIYVGNITKEGEVILYNHLDITIKTHHVTGGNEVRIVGFEVEPRSVDRFHSIEA